MPPGPPSVAALCAATLLALAARAPAQQDPDAAALYAANCARCHGADGSGRGTETLDRPARSFTLGGFSFGNTEQAIARTLARGIPGSPMPAFETLSEDARLALARHVLAFGPPREEVADEQTVLQVDARGMVVRGLLPPVASGAPERTRGLLAGGPDGLSFEYDADDLRLLAVRAGGFVRRSDWTGRGGTPLEPLGVPVWLDHGGDPPAPFRLLHDEGGVQPLRARLVETRLDGPSWWLAADLHGPAPDVDHGDVHPLAPDPASVPLRGPLLASARQTAAAFGTSAGAGFVRRWHVRPARTGVLQLRLPGDAVRERWRDGPTTWTVHDDRAADGTALTLLRGVSGLPDHAVGPRWASVRPGPGQLGEVALDVTVLLLPTWDDALREGLRAELAHAPEGTR